MLAAEGPFLGHEEGNAATAEFLVPWKWADPGRGGSCSHNREDPFPCFLFKNGGV